MEHCPSRWVLQQKAAITAYRIDLSAAAAHWQRKASGLELTLYTKTGMGDGQQANNPWLQEFPDPITRVAWDNYLTVAALMHLP